MSSAAKAYALAAERYASIGVDTEKALKNLKKIAISMHCWQGDDVAGFEESDRPLSGGIMATGNYMGKARNAEELRADIETAMKLIPGKHRLNLHSIYAETNGKKVSRDKLETKHFRKWLDWAGEHGIGLDFNPSCFSHPMADSGVTLSSADDKVREFWIRHVESCRKIAADFGRELKTPCVNNIWIPDGSKDLVADRLAPRKRLKDSLDRIFKTEYDKKYLLDAVESKLFGIGSESYVVGSHEFYMGYAVANDKMICLDSGHFHPTESIADKLSAILLFTDEALLHVSRGVRWDSDHVVLYNDELLSIAQEIVRNGFTNRVHIGLDYFDAGINRIAAWVIGMRNMQKALLAALLEPIGELRKIELAGNNAGRLALFEELKTMPIGAVWDQFCEMNNAPVGTAWIREVEKYEKRVLSAR